MVQKEFKLVKDAGEYKLEYAGEFYPCPKCLEDDLKGRYVTIERFVDSNLVIALAGVTDSLRMVDQDAFDRNSVLKEIRNVPEAKGGIAGVDSYDDVRDFEKYHIVRVERDIKGDDDSLHAYMETAEGKMRVRFPNDARLDAKRNNRYFWVENYKIQDGTAGGKHVIPLADSDGTYIKEV